MYMDVRGLRERDCRMGWSAVVAMLLMGTLGANAQTGNEWDDPLKTSVNREAAHTLAIPMASESDVTKNDMTVSPYYQS